jgi:hypothetical protein
MLRVTRLTGCGVQGSQGWEGRVDGARPTRDTYQFHSQALLYDVLVA